jgi:hypothetical protein
MDAFQRIVTKSMSNCRGGYKCRLCAAYGQKRKKLAKGKQLYRQIARSRLKRILKTIDIEN